MENKVADILNLAGFLYDTFCYHVSGVSHDGKTLPTWKEFKADPSKHTEMLAWCAVAEASIEKQLTAPSE